MNKNIFNLILGGAVALGMASCSENSWNDRYLDGFEGGEQYSAIDVEYTLTADDYATIAAGISDPDVKAIVSSQLAFPTAEAAQQYIPILLSKTTFPYYYAVNGSNVKVTYNLVNNLPSQGAAIASAETYTVTKADYQNVWGSEVNYVEAFTPSHPAAASLPGILNTAISDPAQGSYAMVSYQVSDQNPDFGSAAPASIVYKPVVYKPTVKRSRATAGTTSDQFSSVIGSLKNGDNMTSVMGAVTGICKQGFIITDNTGSILAYQGNSFDQTSVKIGDIVVIENKTISQYNGGLQIPISSSSDYAVEGSIAYTYPTPVTVNYADAAAACANTDLHNAVYVSFSGTPIISGNYVNIDFPGATGNIQGSAYQIPADLQAKCAEYAGKEVVFTGYFVSVSSSRYYNVLITDVQEKPEITSNLTSSLKTGDKVSATGVVTAICTRGFILTDNAGSLLIYQASGFSTSSVAIGEIVTIQNATLSAYNGILQDQISGDNTYATTDTYISYSYPTPTTVNGTTAAATLTATDNVLESYIEMEVTPFMSGNYLNFQFAGTSTDVIVATLYQAPADLTADLKNYIGKTVTLRGYYCGTNKNSKLYNIMVTDYDVPTVSVDSETQFALMTWDGTAWQAASDVVLLQPADYASMGQSGNFISNTAPYFPKYLAQKVPYASAGDTQLVAYFSAQGVPACQNWIFDGTTWVNDTYVEGTDQFTKANSVWSYNPSVIINLPATRNDPFVTPFYQACTDWVYENIDVPLGSTSITSGVGYVTSYGNNEYWAGTSAYYNNVDIRASSAKAQYPAGYEGMSDAEIQQLMVERLLMTLFPGVLAERYPDAVPVDGIEVTYTINFILYTGSNYNATVKYVVTAPKTFEFEKSNIWSDGKFVLPTE